MAYYITYQRRKNEYVPLEITKSKYFARLSNLKNNGATLQEIDVYTMMFNDETEFRKSLYEEGLVERRNAGSPLSIRILHGGKYRKVTYDFLYQKDMEYVMEPKLIIAKIEDKLYQGDFRFIDRLANHYLKYCECSSTAPEVRNAALDAILNNGITNRFSKHDEQGDNILTRMLKLLIYKYYEKPNGTIEYKEEVEYRNVHSLIAFINNYDKKYSVEDPEIKDQKSIPLPVSEETKPKTRSRNKKNMPLEGQTSLFD